MSEDEKREALLEYKREHYRRNKSRYNAMSAARNKENRQKIRERWREKNPLDTTKRIRREAAALARSLGKRTYSIDIPCPEGHLAGYMTKGGQCVQCQSDYRKKWRIENRELDAAYTRKSHAKTGAPKKWRDKTREYRAAHAAAYCKANAKKLSEAKKKHYLANGDRYRAQMAEYRAANRDKIIERRKREREETPDRIRARERNLRAKRRAAEGKHTADDIAAIKKLQRERCAYCRVKLGDRYHVDHIQPLIRGGSNYRQNLQILCQHCNCTKHTTDPLVYARRIGFLL